MKQLIIMLAGMLVAGWAGAQGKAITAAELAGKWQADSVLVRVYDQSTDDLIREVKKLAKDSTCKLPRFIPVLLNFRAGDLVLEAKDGSGWFGTYEVSGNQVLFINGQSGASENAVKEVLVDSANWRGTHFYTERVFYYAEPATGRQVKVFYRCRFVRK